MNQQLQNLSSSNALKVYQACNFLESATKSLWVDGQLASPNSQLNVDQQKLWESLLKRILDKTITTSTFWFGGALNGYSGDNVYDRLLSIGLYLIEVLSLQDTNAIAFFLNISKFYRHPGEFAARLLANDERCINVLFILLKRSEFVEKLETPLWQDVRLLFVEVFAQIRFDALVLLEWMQSEVIALALINRILNDVKQEKNWTLWKKAFEKSKFAELSHANTYAMIEPEPQRDDVVLKISELAVDIVYDKEIRFNDRENINRKIPQVCPEIASKEAFVKMFSELRSKLARGDQIVHFKTEKLLGKIDEFLRMIK
ncbi:unnamed protein product, partial [Mesorhabditis belari]|uniref:Uncharacterized protein n=1 Tax=Mesorhabditis belari TaxID=2138241 RepID=A0AAF3FF17_9BILA